MTELNKLEMRYLIYQLEKKYSNRPYRLNIQEPEITHGKVVRVLFNTHCNIKIVKFERGNEFITEHEIERMLQEY